MPPRFQRLARRQLSEALARFAAAAVAPRPRDGWIAAIRKALDMTVQQFAARLGVAPSSVVRLEQRERDDAITLGALRRAAGALDCDLIYAVVPRHIYPTLPHRTVTAEPGPSMLDALIEARALEVATAELQRIAHTMALEHQEVRAADLDAQIAERVAALVEAPRHLWDADVAPHATHRSATRGGRPA